MPKWLIQVSPEMDKQIRALVKSGELAAFVRELVAKKLGDKTLAAMPMGRPKNPQQKGK